MIDVCVEVIREGVTLPTYANPYDAGMDVCAAEELIIKPGETVIIPTGLKFAIPEGYEIQVRPRSGISVKTPLRISNSPGTIDAGYRDELGIIMTNTSLELCKSSDSYSLDSFSDDKAQAKPEYLTINNKGNKKGSYLIKKGERIAQLVLAEVPRMNLKQVDSVADIGTNRGGGFGSTGV